MSSRSHGRSGLRDLVACGQFLAVLSMLSVAGVLAFGNPTSRVEAISLSDPILFVTQVPIPYDFTNVASPFGNHLADPAEAPRGGDLHILYPDGTLRNLTQEAGYGGDGFQGADSIAVREPAVHWSGLKAVFSMVVGAPTQRYAFQSYRWQLYEVTGLGLGETALIQKVPNQPEEFNNVSPIYASDGRIIFTSDRPRSGEVHLYPQLDEYETAPTNTGLWKLDPATAGLELLDHSPSGDFKPIVDSFGRLIFTRWDHLQRDQQADADALDGNVYGTFDYADESAAAEIRPQRVEVFPEPRSARVDLLQGTNLEGLSFNHFFPWMAEQDGTALETLNHVGRHELHFYFNRVFNDDPSLDEFIDQGSGRVNPRSILNFLQIREDPLRPGRYLGVDAPEFFTHGAGQIVSMEAPPGLSADQMVVEYLTHPETSGFTDGAQPPAGHSGLYRSPLPLSNGKLIAVHTSETRQDQNQGNRAQPISRYDFRLKGIERVGDYWQAAASLTTGVSKTISFYDPDVLVSYSGLLWELDPVEVRPRTAPPSSTGSLPETEAAVFAQEGIDLQAFQDDLRSRGLALVVSRNVTTRDDADRQQPFNLRIAGGEAESVGDGGQVYGLAYLQFFQGDQVRGIGGKSSPRPGRRVLARPMHDSSLANPPITGPEGSVRLASDGSMAALVPARRALSWQLTDPQGTPVVRERYWLTFQPGEIRVCTSCHGLNEVDQAGEPAPQNAPLALRELLEFVKSTALAIFADGFESGDTSAWSLVFDPAGHLSVSGSAALEGSQGLAIQPGARPAYLGYRATTPRKVWRVRFLFDPNSAGGREGLSFRRKVPMTLLTLSNSGKLGRLQAALQLRRQGAGYAIRGQAAQDGGDLSQTPWVSISDGPQELSLEWRRASQPNNSDGSLTLRVGGLLAAGPLPLTNFTANVSSIRLGVVSGATPALSGTLHFDAVRLEGGS